MMRDSDGHEAFRESPPEGPYSRASIEHPYGRFVRSRVCSSSFAKEDRESRSLHVLPGRTRSKAWD